jgi:hypothetical protein
MEQNNAGTIGYNQYVAQVFGGSIENAVAEEIRQDGRAHHEPTTRHEEIMREQAWGEWVELCENNAGVSTEASKSYHRRAVADVMSAAKNR